MKLKRDGEDWYVVMQGEYESKNIALLVYDKFPAEIKTQPPWARSFGSIQEVLADGH